MADFSNLILLAILSALLLIVILIFGNKICGFTTAHKELYIRRDYFSIQTQLSVIHSIYFVQIVRKNKISLFQPLQKLMISLQAWVRFLKKYPFSNFQPLGTNIGYQRLQFHPKRLIFQKKVLIQSSCNFCRSELCLQENDT